MAEDKIPAGSLPPEKEEAEPVEPKTYAGKFESPEDLEKSYLEAEKKLGSRNNEVGDLKKQNEELMAALNKLSDKPEKVEKTEKPAAPDVASALDEIGAMYEKGDLTFTQAMAKASEITANSVQYQANERLAKTEQALIDKFQSTLSERDQQVQIDQFHKNNPDYTDFVASEDYVKIMEEDPMHDDYSAYRVFKEREKAQAAIEEAQRVRNGSEPAKTVASKPGHNVQQQNKTRTSDMGELKQRMRAKLDDIA